ncbi:MAG: glycosyltransferase family A protein [Bacteroidia bacterium]|nr:glycosyltransferase family A protein [Bacteroidia bacterium]
MQASIIIPSCNRADQLFRCMKSLVALDFASAEYEIIIVDNGSTDNTREVVISYVKEYPEHIIRYFYDAIPGLLTGRHRGAKEAKSEILVYVDDDIHAEKGWLTAIVDSFKRYPEEHLVGGKCLPIYETEPPDWLAYFWQTLPDGGKMLGDLSLCDFGEAEKEVHPTWVFGLNFSILKTSLYDLGGFHPDCISPQFQHFQGDGESGLSMKAFEKGYKAVYNPKALVYHEVPAERMTLGYFDNRYFYQGICNSYTEIRRNNGITSMVARTSIKRKIKNILRPLYRIVFSKPKVSIQSETNFEKGMLFTRFRAMERAGYNFHQEMARKNPVVLNWVLKENYFDYELPKY